jgi:O-antigen/teichoic acid export membrane protein
MGQIPSSRAVRLAWNTGWNAAGQAGLAALTFWLIPFIIGRLGPEGYALYSLMGIVSGYLMLLTFGAGPATVKYASEHVGASRMGDLGTLLGASACLHAFFTLLGAAAVIALRHRLAGQFFLVRAESLGPAAWVLACAGAAAVFLALAQYGQSVLQGLQRYDLATVFSLLQSALLLGSTALLLRLGLGLRAIGWLFVAACAAQCAAVLAAVRRASPSAPLWAFWRGERGRLGDFWVYAASSFVGQLAWSAAFQWDKLFIGALLPLSQLTYYVVPSAILQKFWMIPSTITTAAFPMLSELHGTGDPAALKRFYRKCSQLILWMAVPGFVMLMVLAPQFLTLWLGGEFSRYGTWPLRLLAMGYFIYFMGIMPGMAAGGLGRVRYVVGSNLALGGCCLLLWRILIPRLGIDGAAWGFLLSMALVDLPFLACVNRDFFKMSAGEYLREVCLRPFAAGAVLFAVMWLARLRLYTWGSFLLAGFFCAAVYFAAGWALLDEDSRGTLRHVGSVFLERLRPLRPAA